jgi:rhodanese-related sulfurtransferase/DNA-binding MarR family transcriptional regulator
MGSRVAKNALYDGFAEVAKAIGSGRRADLVDLLCQGERHVDELAGELEQSVANTSHHLRVLAAAGLVTTRREGTRIYYRLASERVADLWCAIRDVAIAHSANLDGLAEAYTGHRRDVEPISRDELARRLAAGDIIVLDVRPPSEYQAGHIRGARSLPLEELRRHLRELPAGAEVIAYCRGPFCVYADDAVRRLRRKGFKARRLEDGYPEWRRAGYPTTTGANA